MRTELGQLTPHQRRRLAEHHQTAAVQAWMAAVKEKRRKNKKRRKKKLPKSGRLLPLSARCLVRQWIHVHEEPFANLDIFSKSPLFLAITSLVFLRQSMAAFGKISHILHVLSYCTRQVSLQLRAARSLTMCLPLVSALKVVRTAGRCKIRGLSVLPLVRH